MPSRAPRQDAPPRRRKQEPDAYHSKIMKAPSKRQIESVLKHAVTHADAEALEDWDECR